MRYALERKDYEELFLLGPGETDGEERRKWLESQYPKSTAEAVLELRTRGLDASAPAPPGPVAGGAAIHVRVPKCGATWTEMVRLWLGGIRRLVSGEVPVLLLEPLQRPWLDILIGDPGPQEFVCLRATPGAIPLTTEIPYTMDAAFRERAGKILAGEIVPAQQGAAAPLRARGRPTTAGQGRMATLRAWLAAAGISRRRLVVLLLVLVGLLLLGVLVERLLTLFLGGEGPPAPPDRKPPAAADRPDHWKELCRQYHAWLFAVLTDVNEPFSRLHGRGGADHLEEVRGRRRRWQQDACLSEVVSAMERFVEAGLDPPSLIGQPLWPPAKLARWPESRLPEGSRRKRVAEAREGVERIRGRLDRWPCLSRLVRLADLWRSRGWSRGADHLDGLAEQVRSASDLALRADAVMAMTDRLDQWNLEGCWQVLGECRVSIGEAPDAGAVLLGRFDELAEAAAAGARARRGRSRRRTRG